MTNEQMKQYAEELRRFIVKTEEASFEIVEVEETATPAIEILPSESNSTGAFYWTTEVVDFCRGRNLSFWISPAEFSDGRSYAYAHIF